MATTPISIRLDEVTKTELDEIAQSLDRDRSWVINEAIKSFLEVQRWNNEQIRKGFQALNEGRTVSHDDVKARIAKLKRKTNQR
jgi:predicted transcriptional regulator